MRDVLLTDIFMAYWLGIWRFGKAWVMGRAESGGGEMVLVGDSAS